MVGHVVHKLFAQQIAEATAERGELDLVRLADLVGAAYEDFARDRRDLQAQNLRFNTAVSNMSQGLVMFDAAGRLVIHNPRYAEIYRLKADALAAGQTLRDLLDLRVANGTFSGDPQTYIERLRGTIEAGETLSNFTELEDGRTIAVVSRPMAGGGWVATHEDITERRRAQMKIEHMARHDALTDLANRVLLRERLSEALLHVERGQKLAVLCLDLDQFKCVNDSLGHPVGDELLRTVAGRLQACVRETDTISRLGGDEFCIVQTDIADATDAERLARRIAEAIRATYNLHGHSLNIDVSIGIALAPTDGTDADELIKHADMALYGAKGDGRGVYRFFEPTMDARMKARRALELALRRAFEKSEFELYYQPVLNLAAGDTRCCEALLRWHCPERGLVLPVEFVPVVEEMGLIVALGEWVIRQACHDAAQWPSDICVAINLSPTQLAHKNLVPTVLGALAAAQLSARRLELEITEAVLMQNTDATLQTLHQLRALGIRISMDDFGTGYSSLSYLRSFPFDKLKIDRCFVSGLDNSAEASAIVQAVTALAGRLGMTTTAEGVETVEELERVRALGCTDVQGFLYSRPMPVRELARHLGEQSARKDAAA
ncbi:MAG: EAL domain-containing protein [Alphaproteobacteria bacterium]|nr:EAL domain-containing protein [Alphaproteobacteria bacterium]